MTASSMLVVSAHNVYSLYIFECPDTIKIPNTLIKNHAEVIDADNKLVMCERSRIKLFDKSKPEANA